MVENEEDGGSTGLEVFHIASFDADGALAADIFERESIVVYLLDVRSCLQTSVQAASY